MSGTPRRPQSDRTSKPRPVPPLGGAFVLRSSEQFGHTSQFSSFPDVQLHIVDAPLGAGPESILPAVVMDSGLALRAPRNDGDNRIERRLNASNPVSLKNRRPRAWRRESH